MFSASLVKTNKKKAHALRSHIHDTSRFPRKLLGKLPRNPHVMKIVERKLEALRVKYFSRSFVGNSYC